MKLLMCLMFVAVGLCAVSAGYIHSGWYPSYSSPVVYSRPVYPLYSGWTGGYGSGGWSGGYGGSGWAGRRGWTGGSGWNSGWKSGW